MAPAQIGIVIPTYNSGSYLSEAIESAVRQTVPAQIVVVDDCSTDEQTAHVIDAWKNKGVTVIRHEVNQGVSAALNTGIEHLSTPFILPLAGDDRILPQLGERAIAVMESNFEFGIVSFDLLLFGTQNYIKRIEGTPNGVVDMIFDNALPGTSVFRRADWATIGGFAVGLDWGEDWDFWVRILALGRKSYVIHEPLYEYRQHDAQVTAVLSAIEKRVRNLSIVERNRELWAANVVTIMSEYWIQQDLLRSYRRRYGWMNNAVSRTAASAKRLRSAFNRHQ